MSSPYARGLRAGMLMGGGVGGLSMFVLLGLGSEMTTFQRGYLFLCGGILCLVGSPASTPGAR